MRKILDTEVIYNAFMDTLLKKLPKKESDYPDWYKERLEKCASCKYNTKNIPNRLIPTGGLYFSKLMGKNRCSICTCFIKQKAWSKTEECAMGETDARPAWLPESYKNQDNKETSQWNRIEVITMRSDEFNLESTDPKKYNIDLTEDGQRFEIRFVDPVKSGDNVDTSFILKSRHDIFIKGIKSFCGCTNVHLDVIDDSKNKITATINTSNFGSGEFRKSIEVKYELQGISDKEELIVIDIVGNIVSQ